MQFSASVILSLHLSKLHSGTNVPLFIWLQCHQINWTNQSGLSGIFHSVTGNQWVYGQSKRGEKLRVGGSMSPGPASDPVWGTVTRFIRPHKWPSCGCFKHLLKINLQHNKTRFPLIILINNSMKISSIYLFLLLLSRLIKFASIKRKCCSILVCYRSLMDEQSRDQLGL